MQHTTTMSDPATDNPPPRLKKLRYLLNADLVFFLAVFLSGTVSLWWLMKMGAEAHFATLLEQAISSEGSERDPAIRKTLEFFSASKSVASGALAALIATSIYGLASAVARKSLPSPRPPTTSPGEKI
jgi:hypothetical protein